MKKMISIAKAAEMIGVTPKTLRVWDKESVLKPLKTPKGHRRYNIEDINNLMNNDVANNISIDMQKVYVYCRVSTKKQADAGNLERQKTRLVDFCNDKNYEVVNIFEEVASGVNDNRKKLTKMLNTLESIDKLVVEYPDRLSRFGLNYILMILKQNKVEIEFINSIESKSVNEEMAEDIISIITSFSAKLYGARGGRKVKSTLRQLSENKCIKDVD